MASKKVDEKVSKRVETLAERWVSGTAASKVGMTAVMWVVRLVYEMAAWKVGMMDVMWVVRLVDELAAW